MRTAICFLMLTLMAGLCAPLLAAQSAAVGIGSTKIITVAPVHGMTLSQRARALQARLVDILSVLRAGQDPEVRVEIEEGGPVVFVKGIRFLTVTEADGRLHKSSPVGLAALWAERLEKLLPEIAPINAPEDVLTPALTRPQVSITRDAAFAGTQAGQRRFNITITARGDGPERLIQITRRDENGVEIVVGERLRPSRPYSVGVVTQGSVVFEVFQDESLVHREHLPLARRQ